MTPRAVSPARASTVETGPRAARLASFFARQVRYVSDGIPRLPPVPQAPAARGAGSYPQVRAPITARSRPGRAGTRGGRPPARLPGAPLQRGLGELGRVEES